MASELAHKIADRLAVDVSEVEPVLDAAVDRIRQQVSNFGYARLSGLGTFRGRDGVMSFEPDPVLAESANIRFSGLGRLDVDIATLVHAAKTIEPDTPAPPIDQDQPEPSASVEDVEPAFGMYDFDSPTDQDDFDAPTDQDDFDAPSVLDDFDESAGRDDFDASADRDEIEPLSDIGDEDSIADVQGEELFVEVHDEEPLVDIHDEDSVTDLYEEGSTPDVYGEEGELSPDQDDEEIESDFVVGDEWGAHVPADMGPSSDDEPTPTVTWNSAWADPAEPVIEDHELAEQDAEVEAEPVAGYEEEDVRAESDVDEGAEFSELQPDDAAVPIPTVEETEPSKSLEDRVPVEHAEASREGRSRRNLAGVVGVVLLIVVAAVVAYFVVSPTREGAPTDQIVAADPGVSRDVDPATNDQQVGDGASTTDPEAGTDPGPSGDTQPLETTPNGDTPLTAGANDAGAADATSNERADDSATPTSQDPLRGSGGIDRAAGGYTIVVFSDRSQANAGEVAQRYQSNGYRAEALAFDEDSGTQYRVAVGQFATLEDALAARDRLAGSEIPDDAWLLRVR